MRCARYFDITINQVKGNTMIQISKIAAITINGRDFLLDDNNEVMSFVDEVVALKHLMDNGVTTEDISESDIKFEQVDSDDKYFALVMIATDSEGSCTVESFESLIEAYAVFADIKKNGRKALSITNEYKDNSAGISFDTGEDITVAIDFENKDAHPYENGEYLFEQLNELGYEHITI